MISKLAARAALFFANKDVYGHEEIESYKYGFQVMISTAINLICVLIISILTSSALNGLLFILAFIPLRMTAGGYHAKHHWSCIWGFIIIFFGFSMLCNHLNIRFVFIYTLISIVFSSLMVWIFSPIEAINKPLTEEKRKRNRKHSLIIVGINMAIVVLSYYIPNSPVKLLSYYISGSLAAGLLLPLAYFVNKKAKRQAAQIAPERSDNK